MKKSTGIIIIMAVLLVGLTDAQITQDVKVLGTLEVRASLECETDAYMYGGIYDGATFGAIGEVLYADGLGNMDWLPPSPLGTRDGMRLYPNRFFTTSDTKNVVVSPDGAFAETFGDDCNPIAQFVVPYGYKAVDITVYGDNTDPYPIIVYRNSIEDGTTAINLGSGPFNTTLDIADAYYSDTEYITITCDVGNGEKIYGAFVNLEEDI